MEALSRRAAAAWRAGAAAAFGPLVVLVFLFGTLFGAVGVVQVMAAWRPWGPEAALTAGLLTLLLGPWFVTRGWIERERL